MSVAAPWPVAAALEPTPLHGSAATRAIETAALAATPEHALMARAGLAVARLSLALWPHAQHIAVLAGPGNNGGDALVAALHLHAWGREVMVVLLADPQRLPADAAWAWQQAEREAGRAGLELKVLPPGASDAELASAGLAAARLAQADLLIDGLLGLGATRAPTGVIAAAIAAANAASAASALPVLAIDLPSGLDAGTGGRLGAEAIRADATLALLTLKPGLFTAEGRDLAGAVWLDDLGQPGDAAQPTAWLGAAAVPPAPGFAPRRHAQHKGSFGDVYVVGGADGMQGAAQLCANAALTAGAGRVYLSLLGSAGAAGAASVPPRPELMQRTKAWEADAALLQRATVVCGCGGGGAVATALPRLLDEAGRLLLDADALNAVANDPALLQRLRARAERGVATVLTPHPLEAARLLGSDTATVQADRLAAARAIADRCAAVVLLKGSGSVIAAPGGVPWINASGNAALATPGSGDVLAGWIGGLWSQQARTDALADAALFATRAATWLHGRAAELSVPAANAPLPAGDLVDAMARVLAAGC